MVKESGLLDHVIPLNYNLFFEPDLKNFTFIGKAKIKLKISKPTNRIILNSKELLIKKVYLKHRDNIIKPRIKLSKKGETLVLLFNKKIRPSISELNLDFQGILNDNLSGFYRSKYHDKKGKVKYLTTTQFEAPYARQAFPCFDEPDKKATFDISLKIDKKLQAISNMPIDSENTQENKKTVIFQTTPVMSTYLLYMGAGEFEFLEGKYRNVKIRIAALPGKSKEGAFALDLTKKFLKYFESYSKIKYPLKKLDLIAIPDFAAGAMENWGAITFREILLLFNPKKTSTRIKKRIAEVIAHELWHQWSGNLVTMKWWDDLWLNESFATYMAFKAVDHYFPKWKMWEDFIDTETSGAFSADALKTTHPIAVPVSSPNEVEEIFDEISYGKGGSVLRMIESYLGKERFRRGVSKYLSKYKYKNTVASDLWDNLSKVSHVPIKEIMENWINQPGYPLLTIKQRKNKLILSQKRFNSKKKQTWKIPLTINVSGKLIKKLVEHKKEKLRVKSKWFKVNADQEGFYRTKYPKENIEELKKLILKKQLSILDRWSIQNDIFHLCLIGEITAEKYLDLITSYKNENSYFVLSDIYSNLYQIHYIFSYLNSWEKIWPKFKEHIKEPFQKNFSRLGWKPKKNENINDSLLRSLTIGYLSFSEDKKIIKEGMKKFHKGKLHPDLQGAIYGLASTNGNKKIYKKIMGKYNNSKNIEEKIKLLSSLYKFKDKDILKNSLNFALSDKVRTQDLRTVFSMVSSNSEFRSILLPWIKSNWHKLKKYEKTHFVFMGLLESLITSHIGNQKEKEIRKFLKSKRVKYEKTKANSFEVMQMNTSWIKNNKRTLESYFK